MVYAGTFFKNHGIQNSIIGYSLDEYIELVNKLRLKCINFEPMSSYILTRFPKHKISKILRFENLDNGWNKLSTRLGMNNVKLNINYNKSEHTHYSKYYNDHNRKIIKEIYQVDLDRFGYSFEDE